MEGFSEGVSLFLRSRIVFVACRMDFRSLYLSHDDASRKRETTKRQEHDKSSGRRFKRFKR
jgi:hypothetical protein